MKFLNPDQFHFEDAFSTITGIPPDPEKQELINQKRKLLQKQGKKIIRTCCTKTSRVLEGALRVGTTEDDFEILRLFFFKHTLTRFGVNQYLKRTKLDDGNWNETLDIQGLVDKQFKTVASLSSLNIQIYFLDAIVEEVSDKEHNSESDWFTELRDYFTLFNNRRFEFFKEKGKRKLHSTLKNAGLSRQLIADTHDILLAPFKHCGELNLLEKKGRHYSSNQFDGWVKSEVGFGNGFGCMTFTPEKDEIEKINYWHRVEEVHKLLVALLLKQEQLGNTNHNLESFKALEQEIQEIRDAIIPVYLKEGESKLAYDYYLKTEDEPLYNSLYFQDYENRGKHTYKDCLTINSGGKTYKVYSAGVAVILTGRNFTVQRIRPEEIDSINGRMYLATYIEGYEEGEAYFKKNFGRANELIYGSDAATFVRNLNRLYFHEGREPYNDAGWDWVIGSRTYLLNRKTMRDYGYYSGIISQVHDLVKRNKDVFDKHSFWTYQISRDINQPSTNNKRTDETRASIEMNFQELPNGWQYAFKKESDFEDFLSILVSFFEQRPYQIPLEGFSLRKRCGTRLAKMLGQIHKSNSEETLANDVEYHRIALSLSPFKDMDKGTLVRRMYQ